MACKKLLAEYRAFFTDDRALLTSMAVTSKFLHIRFCAWLDAGLFWWNIWLFLEENLWLFWEDLRHWVREWPCAFRELRRVRLFWQNRGFSTECRAHSREYRVLLTNYRVLLEKPAQFGQKMTMRISQITAYKALLTEYRVLMTNYTALLKRPAPFGPRMTMRIPRLTVRSKLSYIQLRSLLLPPPQPIRAFSSITMSERHFGGAGRD